MESETRNCQNCKKDFVIEPDDFGFYEKMKVPPSTFCVDCRKQRRWVWRNNISLYNRKCELCDKGVVSLYSPESPFKIYCNKCWWSDNWDSKSYGVDYDFSRPFFSQFQDLLQSVPQIAIVNDDGIASINCEYTQDWWFSKNCYMCFSGWHAENVMYSTFVLAGKYIMDCMEMRSPSEWMYECRVVSQSYKVKYSEIGLSCIDGAFLYNCRNCQDCFMSFGLQNKKYHFKNQKYEKSEYEKILASYRLDTYSGVEKAKKEYDDFLLNFPRRFAQIFKSLNCTGDTVSYSKNSQFCFGVKKFENCRYCDFGSDNKDSLDVTMSGELSECYESSVVDHSQKNFFGVFSVKSQDIKYCQHCHNCKYCFGCVGLRNAKYCIFNKQYTKEEYEELVPKIIEQMNSMPYVDKMGLIYKYGEFYPIEISPFGYNETYAPELVPLSREDALERGYKWQDHQQKTEGKETLKAEDIPESINDIDESILNEILACISCSRNYKIVPNELIFYKNMKIPIPRKCFGCRYRERVTRRHPYKLWHRTCMCECEGHNNHAGKCEVEFETSYAPERPEIVYCEKCYQQEVY